MEPNMKPRTIYDDNQYNIPGLDPQTNGMYVQPDYNPGSNINYIQPENIAKINENVNVLPQTNPGLPSQKNDNSYAPPTITPELPPEEDKNNNNLPVDGIELQLPLQNNTNYINQENNPQINGNINVDILLKLVLISQIQYRTLLLSMLIVLQFHRHQFLLSRLQMKLLEEIIVVQEEICRK